VKRRGAALAATLALGLLAAAWRAVPAARAGELTQLADGEGRDLTVGRCLICHSLEYIPSNAPALDRAGWQKEVQKMKDRFGAPISDAEARQILDYLSAHYSGKAP
jgi:mono/diheme cytochrome c family protein